MLRFSEIMFKLVGGGGGEGGVSNSWVGGGGVGIRIQQTTYIFVFVQFCPGYGRFCPGCPGKDLF